jgi:hypothetical protein
MSQRLKADAYRGKRVRLSAFLKAKNVGQGGGLWMRVDNAQKAVAFDNMGNRLVTGTSDWQKYEIVLDVSEDAIFLPFGFTLMGAGQLWADDFRLDVVSRDVPVTNREREDLGEYDPATKERLKKAIYDAHLKPVNLAFED